MQIDLRADGFRDDARFAHRRPTAAKAVAGIGVEHADTDADIGVFFLVFHGFLTVEIAPPLPFPRVVIRAPSGSRRNDFDALGVIDPSPPGDFVERTETSAAKAAGRIHLAEIDAG